MAIIKKQGSDHDWEIDFGKLILMGGVLVGITVLGICGVVAAEAVVAFYTLITGFIAGNGQNAVKKKRGLGIFWASEEPEDEEREVRNERNRNNNMPDREV